MPPPHLCFSFIFVEQEEKKPEEAKPTPKEKKDESPKVEDDKKPEAAEPPTRRRRSSSKSTCIARAALGKSAVVSNESIVTRLGEEDVTTDCKTSKVVVKGEKADPLKVLERVQRKSHRQVELISSISPLPAPEEKGTMLS
ncbi:heavy metal-associated isoprenylated plant protein 7-like [Salvia miltiorrhiza]|uniref:heavy metal-associated isoprenylated plant protein 7-like n=1 Tax=Salvia miltiorrhiza TaxID=226208 RepID=UPI0025AB7367|nr:heavy metal-associated isoprenylated plant protein 7-like [Salvia miltiorrhiza]